MTPERWRELTTIFHAAREHEGAAARGVPRSRVRRRSVLARGNRVAAGHAGHARRRSGRGAAAFRRDDVRPVPRGRAHRRGWNGAGLSRDRHAIATDGGVEAAAAGADTRSGLQRAIRARGAPARVAQSSERRGHLRVRTGGRRARARPRIRGRPDARAASSPAPGRRPQGSNRHCSIARQIAFAFEAAHDKGIIHRDLKPSNVKITPAGIVKVLDFGIARVANEEMPHAETLAVTRAGAVIGTAAYMSPEQARGLRVDKRTDIWAFGCVLYEMLTGRRAFAGATASDSLAKVLEREPEWSALPASAPESILRLVKRCLQKDPADRLRDIADARLEIDEALARPARGCHDARASPLVRPADPHGAGGRHARARRGGHLVAASSAAARRDHRRPGDGISDRVSQQRDVRRWCGDLPGRPADRRQRVDQQRQPLDRSARRFATETVEWRRRRRCAILVAGQLDDRILPWPAQRRRGARDHQRERRPSHARRVAPAR